MKLVTIGKCVAVAAVVLIGASLNRAPVEAAAKTCVVTIVKNFKGACPAGMKFEGGAAGHSASATPAPAAPTVTPTSAPAGCVKTNVHNFKNSCHAA
jgi:hypothetical protein